MTVVLWKQFDGVAVYDAEGGLLKIRVGGRLFPGGNTYLHHRQIENGDMLVELYQASGLVWPDVMPIRGPFD